MSDYDRPAAENLSYVDVDGVRTRYYENGDGDPMVLIHGGHFGMNVSLETWNPVLTGLSDYFHVYALDKIGQGYTDNPESIDEYTFERVCEHTREFMRELEITGAHIAGHSRGGLVSMWLALNYPDLAETAIVVDSNTAAPVDSAKGYEFYAELEERDPDGSPSRNSVRVEPEANSYAADHITERFIDYRLELECLDKTRKAQEHLESVNDEQFIPSVDRVCETTLDRVEREGMPAPTLVVWGMQDPSAPVEWGLDLFDVICPQTRSAEMHLINRAATIHSRNNPRCSTGRYARSVRVECSFVVVSWSR